MLFRVPMRRYFPLGVNRTNDAGGFSSSIRVRPQVPLSASHIRQRPGGRREAVWSVSRGGRRGRRQLERERRRKRASEGAPAGSLLAHRRSCC